MHPPPLQSPPLSFDKRLAPAPTPRGFTLIELMIVVVVVAILAAVAFPSFQAQIRKGRRADGIAALAQLQQAQERWRSNNTSYTATITGSSGLGLTSTLSKDGHYQLAIVGTPTATTYQATATAVSGSSQTHDSGCTTLTVTVTNGSAALTPATCWNR